MLLCRGLFDVQWPPPHLWKLLDSFRGCASRSRFGGTFFLIGWGNAYLSSSPHIPLFWFSTCVPGREKRTTTLWCKTAFSGKAEFSLTVFPYPLNSLLALLPAASPKAWLLCVCVCTTGAGYGSESVHLCAWLFVSGLWPPCCVSFLFFSLLLLCVYIFMLSEVWISLSFSESWVP